MNATLLPSFSIPGSRTVSDSIAGVAACEFRLSVQTRKVPVRVWSSERPDGAAPLVLVGHGGSGHKNSALVRDIAAVLVPKHGFVVAAIDGPVHGARRAVFEDGLAVRQEFRDLWAQGASVDAMVDDWRAVLDTLEALPGVDARSIGWYGISMGTAYGIPFVAAEPRIRAAVLGMWGTDRVHSERLVRDAATITCPVLFQTKDDDEVFSQAGQLELFESFARASRERRSYPGGHTDPSGDQLSDIETFLVAQLMS